MTVCCSSTQSLIHLPARQTTLTVVSAAPIMSAQMDSENDITAAALDQMDENERMDVVRRYLRSLSDQELNEFIAQWRSSLPPTSRIRFLEADLQLKCDERRCVKESIQDTRFDIRFMEEELFTLREKLETLKNKLKIKYAALAKCSKEVVQLFRDLDKAKQEEAAMSSKSPNTTE